MKLRSSIALVAILSIAGVAGSFGYAQQETESDSRAVLNELLTERRDTLAKRVVTLETKFAQGQLIIDAVIAARDQLLDAELQLVKTKKQRVAIYQKRIDNMRELEDSVKRRLDNGLATPESLLSATAARLQAEIDLVREGDGDVLLQELQGVWILESMEMAGIQREGDELPERFREMQQSIKGDRMTVTRIDNKKYECVLTVNGETEPKQLDVLSTDDQGKSRTAKWIYKIADGKLIIAEGKTTRPTSFETGPNIATKVSTFALKR